MSAPAARREGLASVAVLAVAAGVFLARWWALPQGLSADQSESLALAQSLVAGHGMRLTAASSVLPGPTNLAWLGVQALVAFFGRANEVWLPRASALFGVLAVVLVGLRGAWCWRRWPRLEETVPALALAVVTAFAEACALGSAAASWAFAISLVGVLLGRNLGVGHSGTTGALVASLVVFSPAAAWFLVAAAPAWWIAARLEGRSAARETGRFLAVGGLVVVGVLGARWVATGAIPQEGLFPSDRGAAGTLEFLSRQAAWFWVAIGATLFAAVWRRFHLKGGGTLLAWVVMTVVLASWTDRPRALFLGALPLLAMLVGEGLAAARERTRAKDEAPLVNLAWLGLVLVAALVALAGRASYQLGRIMVAMTPVEARPEIAAEFARRGLRQPLVAWSDGGEAAALFPGARVVVVRAPGRAIEDLLMSEGPPDLVDGRIVMETMPRLSEAVAAGPGGARWLAEQSDDDDPRCPDGRLELLSATPDQVLAALSADVQAGLPQSALNRWRCVLAALPAEQVPVEGARALAAEAERRGSEAEAVFEMESAVRWWSLATQLAGEPPRLRSKTEQLRRRWLEED